MSEEDRSAGRSDGAARSRASEEGHSVSGSECLRATDNASNSAAVSEPPEGIDNENEAAPLHRQQTSASRHQTGRKETFFGIPQSSGTPPNFNPSMFSHWSCQVFACNSLGTDYDDDDYETRFPPDPVYQEASENARVFRVYMEESRKYDAYMTDEAREGLDVLLVFVSTCVIVRMVLTPAIVYRPVSSPRSLPHSLPKHPNLCSPIGQPNPLCSYAKSRHFSVRR